MNDKQQTTANIKHIVCECVVAFVRQVYPTLDHFLPVIHKRRCRDNRTDSWMIGVAGQ